MVRRRRTPMFLQKYYRLSQRILLVVQSILAQQDPHLQQPVRQRHLISRLLRKNLFQRPVLHPKENNQPIIRKAYFQKKNRTTTLLHFEHQLPLNQRNTLLMEMVVPIFLLMTIMVMISIMVAEAAAAAVYF